MDELLGLPEWLAKLLFVAFFLLMLGAYGFYAIGKAHGQLAARRPNPSREEFMQMMAGCCSNEASAFLWAKALEYVRPKLNPHPDDRLGEDLCIDDDDFGMDWPREWAELKEFHESNMPDWPEGWPVTIRNYGRWLDMAPTTSSPRT
ncbi:hypothetical protein AAG596_06015 [Citromicrobium bathyomarinum]|uniref:hypothetical protein n=1 Tax=Citromicrobium bathyomarinum TaxID=72174 RepID=UPI00315A3A6E